MCRGEYKPWEQDMKDWCVVVQDSSRGPHKLCIEAEGAVGLP